MNINDLRFIVETLDRLEIPADEFTVKSVDDRRIAFTVSTLMDADILQRSSGWNVSVVPHPSPSVPLGTEGKIRIRVIL